MKLDPDMHIDLHLVFFEKSGVTPTLGAPVALGWLEQRRDAGKKGKADDMKERVGERGAGTRDPLPRGGKGPFILYKEI
jgi:hypothetical protein